MGRRVIIDDSDEDSDQEAAGSTTATVARVAVAPVLPVVSVVKKDTAVVLSPMSLSDNSDDDANYSSRDRTEHTTDLTLTDDSTGTGWCEKRNTATMSASEKRHNIDLARKQSRIKKRRVEESPPVAASSSASLIKSRHTTRVYDSPDAKAGSSNGLSADYDLSMALLNDTPDDFQKRKDKGLSRLVKNKTNVSERSDRMAQRETGRRGDPVDVEVDMTTTRDRSDAPNKKKKRSKRKNEDSDDDGDNYHYIGNDDYDDDKEGGEEERKQQILELKSREVITRCTELSVTLRKALRSWQSPNDQTDHENEAGEDSNCINLSRITCNDGSDSRNIGGGGEDGTHLLQQKDIKEICPSLELKDYQLVGVNWLKLLHQNNVNGVLADDMGLGKTVQTISFLAWLFTCREDPDRLREQVKQAHRDVEEIVDSDDGDEEMSSSPHHMANSQILPHLIVVPASTLANWCKEFEKFCPTLNVMRFHGSPLDKEEMKDQLRRAFLPKYQPPGGIHEDERIDVVITTYTMFERDSGAEDRSFLKRIPFEYLVLDEAHCIKNSQSSRYLNLRGLNPRRRLLLSGTPVQNDVRELLALLSFLMPKVFKMEYIDFLYDSFMDRFIDTSKKSSKTNGLSSKRNSSDDQTGDVGTDVDKAAQMDRHVSSLHELRCMLAPFVLRRLKCDVLRQMPPKIDVPIKLKMTDRQSTLYENIINTHLMMKTKSNDRGKSEIENLSVNLNLSTSEASNIFSDLRKASNHPLLLRTHFSSEVIMNRIAAVCCSVQHFGDQCDHKRVYQELIKFSDFDLNYLCLEYPSFLGDYQLPSSVLYDSPKMLRLKTLLPELIADGHRILIFSQWTKMMDILGALLGDLQYKFLRLDGSTPVGERQRLIENFETNVDIPIFILSTRAGGLGINLTAADTVILHDLDFNPENDRQAEDRCHRIGQVKEVSVYKLITEDSVDENIFDMGERKKRLSKAVLADGGSESVGSASKGKDTSEINRMLQLALLKAMNKKQAVDLTSP